MKPVPEDSEDALWNLLNVLPPPTANPKFTQNVLREVRMLPEKLAWRESLAAWYSSLFSARVKQSFAVALVLLLGAVVYQTSFSRHNLVSPSGLGTPSIAQGEPMANPASSVEEETLDEQITKDYYRLEVVEQLLARQDVTEFADEELAALLY